MTNQKSYIKLVRSEQGYEIYAINNGKKAKLSKQQKIIMMRVLKKYTPIIKENTYIYPNYNLITLNFLKEKLLFKPKKVNRKKSKNIVPGIVLFAAISLITGFLAIKEIDEIEPIRETYSTVEDLGEYIQETTLPYEIEFVEETPKETIIPEMTENISDTPCFFYDYDTPNDKKAYENSTAYMDTYLKYERIYGIDARLLCAIGAQESSGVHHEKSINGGYATGIMGIENIWDGADIKVFNFETNSYETIKVDYSKIGELDYNIKIGAAIFQECFYGTLRNVSSIPEEEFLAYTIQKYNMGSGNMGKILKLGPNWMDNREVAKGGDKLYVEHVLSRLDNDTTLKIRLKDGTYHEVTLTNKALDLKHART